MLWIAAAWVGQQRTREILRAQLGESLTALAAASASAIKGERLEAIQPGDDEAGLRTWKHLASQLEDVRRTAGLRRVLVVDREGRVRADTGRHEAGHADVPPLPVGAAVPELGQDTNELSRVWEGSPTPSQVAFRGLDGQDYLRGYAPIPGPDGRVVGALGVEGSARSFAALRRHALETSVWGALVALALTVAALGVATALGRPFARLRAAAGRIGHGDLTTPIARERGFAEVVEVSHALESMRRELEARDRQLKMMIAGVAHEVKNPLGGIELFAGLLGEELAESGTGEARGHLARIRGEVGYLSRIVEDFLGFARERRLNLAAFEVSEWLAAAVSLVEPEAGQKQVSLEVEATPQRLSGDEALLTAALVNLLKNAVQASPPGGTVRVTGHLEKTRYTLRVHDTGPGIPAASQALIFEPFFTTREKGTGLGLPLTLKLVEAHAGTLTVRSAPGDTSFELSLPR